MSGTGHPTRIVPTVSDVFGMIRPTCTRPAMLLLSWFSVRRYVWEEVAHCLCFISANDSLVRLVGRFRIAISRDYQILMGSIYP